MKQDEKEKEEEEKVREEERQGWRGEDEELEEKEEGLKRRGMSWHTGSALYCAIHIMMQQKHSLVCK